MCTSRPQKAFSGLYLILSLQGETELSSVAVTLLTQLKGRGGSVEVVCMCVYVCSLHTAGMHGVVRLNQKPSAS